MESTRDILNGKKLLLLAGNPVGTEDIINYARANGVYTIVSDYLPKEESLGKQLADEYWDISTADIEELRKKCIENNVDGVFSGVSEFNMLKAMELSQLLGSHFYCTKEQWNKIEDKESFRKLCKTNRVPCPLTYYTGDDVTQDVISSICYPVIVKPVDSCSSIGITICTNEGELKRAVKLALNNSLKKRIIIEDFFVGEEFTAHYTIANGRVSLACIDNRVPASVHSGAVTTVPIARVYPSSFISDYMEQVNDNMIGLCESLGLNTGVLFVQGLYNKEKNEFSIFEAGLRCAGEAAYRILERVNGNNFMNLLVDYTLLGNSVDYNIDNEDPFLHGKFCCVTSFVSKGGIVGTISGYDDVQKRISSIVSTERRYREGEETPNGDTLRQILLRCVLVCDSKEQLIKDVETINKTVTVFNDKGEDMCLVFNAREFFNM